MAARSGSVRDRLASDLDYEKVKGILDQAMDMTRYERAWCPNCKREVQVEFPDVKSQLEATKFWFEQGFGRAGAGQAPRVEVAEGDSWLESLPPSELARLAGIVVDEEVSDA